MTRTTNWMAFQTRDSKCREMRNTNGNGAYVIRNVAQDRIDDNQAAIERLRAQFISEKAEGKF